jgi:hypothetical protein
MQELTTEEQRIVNVYKQINELKKQLIAAEPLTGKRWMELQQIASK